MNPPADFLMKRERMWELYNQATAFQKRPSEFLAFQNQWVAWQFDRAIFLYGRQVEAKLNTRTKKGKPKYDIYQALGYSAKEAQQMKLEQSRAEGRALRRELGLID